MAGLILDIRALKKQKDVAIFAHSYVGAEILHYVADVRGDSLHLAEQAKTKPEKTFLFAAVKFMAETAKILNPHKSVHLCADDGNCSLADSITPQEITKLRQIFPRSTFVCYVNTGAEVKSLCDVCVTSTNALDVLLNIPNDEIYFLPDKFMGQNLSTAIAKHAPRKKLNFYHGTCIVHEKFSEEELDYWESKEPGLVVLAHPECKPEVVTRADFVGSTSQISRVIRESDQKVFLALTECGLATHLEHEGLGDKRIVGSCTVCPYMKSNTLKGMLRVLEHLNSESEISVPESVRMGALRSLNAMWELSAKAKTVHSQ
jgi:quinolinate synthase